MRVGVVGCGKLGLMVALAIECGGHEVKGYDVNPRVAEYVKRAAIPFKEDHARQLLAKTKIEMISLEELCAWADLLFLAPQTPHQAKFEGASPLPEERADFDYQYLVACVRAVNSNLARPTPCAIISTVLPGTLEREVLPIIGNKFRLVYTPQFIAMGTVVDDFLNPDLVLVGSHDPVALSVITEFYSSIGVGSKLFITDLKTAEGIKVFYNTFVTAKTVLANLYGEMAERLGMNVDDIYKALTSSTERLISSKYLRAGMGDGGGCHPRDNIALSWVARKINLSFDFFTALMTAREKHCEWLADLIQAEVDEQLNLWGKSLPVTILGRSFKPETNIETGSPAVLLSAILKKRHIAHGCFDEYVPHHPGIYFIGTQHERYRQINFPAGSVVIDPFRYIEPQVGVTLRSIGSGREVGGERSLLDSETIGQGESARAGGIAQHG